MPRSATARSSARASASPTPRSVGVRKELRRKRAVDTALDLARREGVSGLTMRRLGDELAVDVAVLYRIFRDKDELLLSVYDRVTEMTLDDIGPVREGERWQDVLRRVAAAIRAMEEIYPAIVDLTFARTTGGPAERRMVELVLSTFARAGLPGRQTVLFYRSFIDTVLALCGQNAALTTLEPEVREKDAAAWSRIYAKLPEEQYPTARAHVTELIAVEDNDIFGTVVDAIITATEKAAERK